MHKVKKNDHLIFFKVQSIVPLLSGAVELEEASVAKIVEFDIDNNFVVEGVLVAVVIVLDT